MTTSSIRFFFLGFLVMSCKPGGLSSSSAASDASSSATSGDAQAAKQLANDPDPIVDLLHTVEATVAVSSKVDNPHDYPEHLVDGKADTAWNGKTGDLAGWIAFRVPTSAKVVRVEITSGYDKTSAKGDLFKMNHRIKKVKVTRQGQLLKEATLDVETRTLQPIDIDAPGGDFRVDVLETVAGTEKSWRELTVSEFRVWGRAGGAPEMAAHLPKMAIGSLDGRPPTKPVSKTTTTDPPRGPFASFAELCAAYDKVLTPLLDAKFTDDNYPGKLSAPHCAARERQPKGFASNQFNRAPFKDAIFVTLDDLEQQHSALLLQTAKGWFRTDVRMWSRSHGDPGCLHGSSDLFEGVTWPTTSTGQDLGLIRIVHRDIRWAQMQEQVNGADTQEVVWLCRVDAQGAAACEGPKTLGTAHEPLPATFDPSQQTFYEIDVDKIPWTSRKKAVVGPAGDLRIE